VKKERIDFWVIIANYIMDGGFFLIFGIVLAASIVFSLVWK
jgi:hypothetical protein